MSSVSDNKMGAIKEADAKIQALCERKEIKEEAVKRFHHLQKDSKVHQFKDTDLNDHIKNWKVIKFAEEQVAYGVNYFLKVEIDKAAGHTLHVRVHRQQHHDVYDFYSLHDTIHKNERTYVWPVDEPLRYFNA